MNILQSKIPFLLIFFAGIITLVASIWDVLSDSGFFEYLLAVYGILIILCIVLVALKFVNKPEDVDLIDTFEKSLEGRLHHFKCPNCSGIFAVKKSTHNNKKPVKMTCPDCGHVGVIPSVPSVIKGDVPKTKSPSVKFKCTNCNERVTLWAEGTVLHPDIKVFSCPYCGYQQPLSKI